MSIMYWLAVGFAALLVLGGLGLVVYMIVGGKSNADTPTLARANEQSQASEGGNDPEQPSRSVFSLPGVETVDMREERTRSPQVSRREMRERTPRSTRRAAEPLKRAPISAKNAAPTRKSDFQELDPNAESSLPKPPEKPRRSFDWTEEEI